MNVDTILGDRNTRYFGVGYKNANYEIITLDQEESEAMVKVNFGDEVWSIKQGEARSPHLSTLDSVIISAMIVEQLLGPEKSADYYVSHFDIRAGGEPVELSKALKVDFTQNGNNFHFNILGMKINLSIRFGNHISNSDLGHESFLTQHLKQSELTIDGIDYLDQTSMATVAVKQAEGNDYAGLGSKTNDNGFSIFEWLIIFSQIGEMLTYQLDNLDRDDCANLWMKRISADYQDRVVNKKQLQRSRVIGEVLKSRVIDKDHHQWRTLTAHGSDINNQVYFSAQMAHELPQVMEGSSNEQ